MENRPTVIYVAGSAAQAHLLRDLLVGQGIRAWIINEAVARGAVDYVGWQTLPRVLVEAKDAAVARQIAVKHDRRGAELVQYEPVDEDEATERRTTPDAWPRCPGCGAPRITYCPICKTTGISFPEADDEYEWGMGLEESAAEEEASCGSCGACGRHERATEPSDAEEAGRAGVANTENIDEAVDGEETGPRRLVLMCPTCSEPFVPRFPRRCAWCDHEFDEGYEPDDIVEPLPETDVRVLAVAAVLLLVLIGVLVYFAMLT